MVLRTVLASLAGAVVLAACSSVPAASPTVSPTQPTAAAPTAAPTRASGATAALAAPTSASAARSAVNWAEFSFDQITTAGDQQMQSRWMVKKGKVRIETSMTGQQMVIVGDPDRNVGYVWTQGQNQVVKIPYDQFEQQIASAPDPEELSKDAALGTPAGTETIDDQLCDVYEIAGTAATLRIWVSKSNSFPIKSEITTSEGTVTTEFKNVKQGGVTDDLFEPPAGMQIVGLGDTSGGTIFPAESTPTR